MAAFDPDSSSTHERDYVLMRNGPVTMFWRPSLLAETLEWLQARGYATPTIDAGTWLTAADMHRDIAAALDFPDYYGHNLAALNDCLRDVGFAKYGLSPSQTGFALSVTKFDQFWRRQQDVANAFLDVFAIQARHALLLGNRLMCLLQSDEPSLHLPAVGSMPVSWNDAEWLDSARRHT